MEINHTIINYDSFFFFFFLSSKKWPWAPSRRASRPLVYVLFTAVTSVRRSSYGIVFFSRAVFNAP